MRGATQANVNATILSSLLLPLPSDVEQKRIAAILDKADRLRRTRRYAQQLSDTFLQSVFVEMFGEINGNSKRWNIEPLDEKISFMTSGSRGWAQYYSDSGDIFLRIQNIGRNQLLLDDLTYVRPPETAEGRRTQVRSGDVLLTVTADLGRTAVVPEQFPTADINQHKHFIKCFQVL